MSTSRQIKYYIDTDNNNTSEFLCHSGISKWNIGLHLNNGIDVNVSPMWNSESTRSMMSSCIRTPSWNLVIHCMHFFVKLTSNCPTASRMVERFLFDLLPHHISYTHISHTPCPPTSSVYASYSPYARMQYNHPRIVDFVPRDITASLQRVPPNVVGVYFLEKF